MQKLELSPSLVDSFAPNPGAVLSGKSLVKSKSFFDLCITPDNSLIYGKCIGSGKNPYVCSMDFVDPSKPVPRCTCPSRQIPCKHVLGLMYVYAGGTDFAVSEVPDDVTVKRDNLNKTAEKKEIKSKKNTTGKVNISSAIKKIDKQLEGIEMAEKLLKNITRLGLSGINAGAADNLKQQVKEMGNYHIKGIQGYFNEQFLYITEDIAKNGAFTRSVEQLIILSALVKKAKSHLEGKKQNPLHLSIDSQIEEQIGHIWKLDELRALGCVLPKAELVQLSFDVVDNRAKKEFVDLGFFICLQNGKIYVKKNFRPYKAAKHIAQDDSLFNALLLYDLFIYPGGINPRIRYDKNDIRRLKREDFETIKKYASDNYAETIKDVKNQLKTPLADKNPVVLLKINQVFAAKNSVIIEDGFGSRQLLKGETVSLLKLFDFNLLKSQSILAMYENDIENSLLSAKPLSIVTDDQIVRLLF